MAGAAQTTSRRILRCLVGAAALPLAALTFTSPRAAELPFLPDVDFEGLLDGRAIVTSDVRSWDDRGLGKTRFGAATDGDSRVIARLAQAALAIEPHFSWDLSAIVEIQATPEQRTGLDFTQAYLQYKPAPTGDWGVKVRAGAFFPPISLENTGLAWTSPYTITPSAIDSWVGEELRTIGGEATVSHAMGDWKVALTGAVYKDNEPAGTLLAYRGWDFDDKATGLMDGLHLPIVPIIQQTGILYKQDPADEPFYTISGRAGYYAGAAVENVRYGSLSLLRYDNRANDRAFDDGQWAWHTSFWSTAAKATIADGLDVLAQGMTGTTTVVTTPVGPIVGVDFRSAYALASKAWDKQRVSFRVDWFQTIKRDIFTNDSNEHGYALTAAYILRPTPKQRITVEVLFVDSTRAERAYLGEAARQQETQAQISYRLFL